MYARNCRKNLIKFIETIIFYENDFESMLLFGIDDVEYLLYSKYLETILPDNARIEIFNF